MAHERVAVSRRRDDPQQADVIVAPRFRHGIAFHGTAHDRNGRRRQAAEPWRVGARQWRREHLCREHASLTKRPRIWITGAHKHRQ